MTQKTTADQRRYDALSSAAVSQQIRDHAQADYHQALAQEGKTRADRAVAERRCRCWMRVSSRRTPRWHRRRPTALAQLNLEYTAIRAPFDGVIGNRRARAGSYVSSGTQLLSLVPAQGLWIDANFKESQLAHMRPPDGNNCRGRAAAAPSAGMSPACRRPPVRASAFCRRKTPPVTSLKSSSACRCVLRWTARRPRSGCCVRDCR